MSAANKATSLNERSGWVMRFVMRFAIFSMLFYRDFKPGQNYIHRDHINQKNPFNKDNTPLVVEILEVRGKWIRYRHTMNNSMWQNESMERDAFNFTFRLYDA